MSAAESEYWNKGEYMMIGMKSLGVSRLSRTLVRGSKSEYETKKMERAAL